MSFTRWLYMNNLEKIKVLFYILPALVLSTVANSVFTSNFIISIIIGILIAVPILAYKNLYYVNIIAKKYNEHLTIDYKTALKQSLASFVVNGLFMILIIIIVIAIWLVSIAASLGGLTLFAVILSIVGFITYLTLDKLSYYVILCNLESNQLTINDYFNNFIDIYKDNLKFVMITTVKALLYSFVFVILLSFISIYGYEINSQILIFLTSWMISFVVYWVDISQIQYLAREYTK